MILNPERNDNEKVMKMVLSGIPGVKYREAVVTKAIIKARINARPFELSVIE
tara:strand:- start:32925 stop:33080 length:156 start_codon:yes stop_codon:yes gene_type:complete